MNREKRILKAIEFIMYEFGEEYNLTEKTLKFLLDNNVPSLGSKEGYILKVTFTGDNEPMEVFEEKVMMDKYIDLDDWNNIEDYRKAKGEKIMNQNKPKKDIVNKQLIVIREQMKWSGESGRIDLSDGGEVFQAMMDKRGFNTFEGKYGELRLEIKEGGVLEYAEYVPTSDPLFFIEFDKEGNLDE